MNLNHPIFTDEAKARAYFESIRWPNGATCPHCGGTEHCYRVTGKSARPGLFHCNDCSGQFTVTTGGVMESSKIPLTKWALGFRLYAASKKGFSAHQLHRMLGITYKSAWFMAHRIREAMAPANGDKIGGTGKVIEADETELSPSRKTKRRPRSRNKKFVALVERGGQVRSVMIDGADSQAIRSAISRHVDPKSTLHTDGAQVYRYSDLPEPAGVVAKHESVDHDKAWTRKGRDGDTVHTNTAEGYFSIFKRGLVGTYQHIGEQHLPRYLAEFDFRQNNRARLGVNDEARTARAIKGAEGKRLTYQKPYAAAAA